MTMRSVPGPADYTTRILEYWNKPLDWTLRVFCRLHPIAAESDINSDFQASDVGTGAKIGDWVC